MCEDIQVDKAVRALWHARLHTPLLHESLAEHMQSIHKNNPSWGRTLSYKELFCTFLSIYVFPHSISFYHHQAEEWTESCDILINVFFSFSISIPPGGRALCRDYITVSWCWETTCWHYSITFWYIFRNIYLIDTLMIFSTWSSNTNI